MADLQVRKETLPRRCVASARAFGEAPENEAWRLLREWATRKGRWGDFDRHPIYGFNKPSPSPGTKEYGYERWLRLDSREEAGDDVVLKEFEGGLFTVTACKLRGAPELDLVLELYLPVTIWPPIDANRRE